ncbi:MAG: homoserine dehydrogenase [Chloroflexi bacterium]|nr:homoserine dehydrogenase [Chloroflexota bacterium]
MNPKDGAINVGLLGLGVVGSGVAKALLQKSALITQQAGRAVRIARILVRDLDKPRPLEVPRSLLTTDVADILENPQVHLVVEVMGGEWPALDYLRRALQGGKSVVTANKEVMAKHGPELLALANKKGVHLLFEASVGGGIPIIRPLMKDLRANEIKAIRAIINGTTNYILTKMTYEDMEFTQALEEAQELGYAEADPTNDVEGIDAAYKLAILASLAFQTRVAVPDVYREGISRLTARDFRYARELGYVIKLMAIARREGDRLETRVHPVLIPQEAPLAKVDGVLNAVEVEGDLVDKVLFHGRGAGSMPTTSAVVGDILEAACNIARGFPPNTFVPLDRALTIRSISDLVTRYYIRTTVSDQAGVLAQMATVLGNLQISIASVIQKESDARAQTAELVITTHPSKERDVQQALKELERLEVVREIGNLLRVEE